MPRPPRIGLGRWALRRDPSLEFRYLTRGNGFDRKAGGKLDGRPDSIGHPARHSVNLPRAAIAARPEDVSNDGNGADGRALAGHIIHPDT